ncbi:hypothetical protein QYE76_004838 [Lolium multiflorum]|uniref:Uncharacterized protein n=1 Tax=Lolium multiflorum TaxID=4521 RepID=A0AAD8RRG9_LOLMU|nr:hypothetical protein QYE76_004838 [Lolium multiflorum]
MAEQEVVVNGVLPREQSSPSSSADNTPATLDDLKKLESSIVSQLKAMMMELITPKPNPIIDSKCGVNASPSQVDSFPCVEIIEQSTNSHWEKGLEDVDTSSKGKDVSPPNDCAVNVPMPMPCILSHGPPPLLESNSFGDWKLLMRSYVRSTSTELWRIIEEGYSPQDPMNLTSREVVDHQLNAIAIDMILLAISPKDRAHIHSLKTAKEAWDKLDILVLEHVNIQSSSLNEGLEKKKELELISLTQAYEEEWCMRMSLETSAMVLEDSNNYFVSQLIKDQDYALGWLRRHNARLLDIISHQEEDLDEYFRLSKDKVSCCDHIEEIAALKRHKVKLVEVNDRKK